MISSVPMQSEGSTEISVVILCYKEGESMREYVANVDSELSKLHIPYEIIIVSNSFEGDTDPSPKIARDIASRSVRIQAVTEKKEGGFGWDVRSGLERAVGEVIAFVDGDGQISPDSVSHVYRAYKNGLYDIVVAQRKERKDGKIRVGMSSVYNFIFRLLFPKVRIRDVNGKPKMLRREVCERLKLSSDDWFIDAELIIKTSYRGYRIGVVPIAFRKRAYKESSVSLTSIFEFIWNMLRYRWRLTVGDAL